jgi:hypothetical protein
VRVYGAFAHTVPSESTTVAVRVEFCPHANAQGKRERPRRYFKRRGIFMGILSGVKVIKPIQNVRPVIRA